MTISPFKAILSIFTGKKFQLRGLFWLPSPPASAAAVRLEYLIRGGMKIPNSIFSANLSSFFLSPQREREFVIALAYPARARACSLPLPTEAARNFTPKKQTGYKKRQSPLSWSILCNPRKKLANLPHKETRKIRDANTHLA